MGRWISESWRKNGIKANFIVVQKIRNFFIIYIFPWIFGRPCYVWISSFLAVQYTYLLIRLFLELSETLVELLFGCIRRPQKCKENKARQTWQGLLAGERKAPGDAGTSDRLSSFLYKICIQFNKSPPCPHSRPLTLALLSEKEKERAHTQPSSPDLRNSRPYWVGPPWGSHFFSTDACVCASADTSQRGFLELYQVSLDGRAAPCSVCLVNTLFSGSHHFASPCQSTKEILLGF